MVVRKDEPTRPIRFDRRPRVSRVALPGDRWDGLDVEELSICRDGSVEVARGGEVRYLPRAALKPTEK